MEFETPIYVYIKTNFMGEITEIGSSVFITDTYNWTMIDSGYGDRYAHAQSQYFPKTLIKENGTYRYSYINGNIVEN